MPQLDFSVLFRLVDKFSAPLEKIQKSFGAMEASVKASESLRQTGEALATAGKSAMLAGAEWAAGGAAVGYGLKKLADLGAEAQAQQEKLAGAFGGGVAGAKLAAAAFEMIDNAAGKTAVSTENMRNAMYLAVSTGEDLKTAFAAAQAALMVSIGTTSSVEAANAAMGGMTELITSLQHNYGMGGQQAADFVAAATTKLAWSDPTQIKEALSYALNPMIAANQSMAIATTLKRSGLDSSMAGTGTRELQTALTNEKMRGFLKLTADGKIDAIASLAAIQQAVRGLNAQQLAYWERQHGLEMRSADDLNRVLANWSNLSSNVTTLANDQGVALERFNARMGDSDSQWALLIKNVGLLSEDVGKQLLPSFQALAGWLNKGVVALDSFVKAHPDFVSMGLKVVEYGGAFMIAAGAVKALFGAMKFGAGKALDIFADVMAHPYLAAFAAIGLAIYEVYQHWDQVKTYFASTAAWFTRVWDDTKSVFHAMGTWFKDWGLTVLGFIVAPWAMIPYEIYKHWGAIKKAVESIAHGIARYFVGHSPIPEGPLHELNLGREVARSFQLAPVVRAAQHVAMATALTSAPMAAMPAMARAGGPAGGATTIHVHYSPTFHGATPADFSAKRHADEIAKLLEERWARRARLDYQHP